jgi:hypothetical protein
VLIAAGIVWLLAPSGETGRLGGPVLEERAEGRPGRPDVPDAPARDVRDERRIVPSRYADPSAPAKERSASVTGEVIM